MNNRVLTYCLMTDFVIFGTVVGFSLLWGMLLTIRAAQHWSDLATVAVFAAAHGLLGLGLCFLIYRSFVRTHRALARQQPQPAAPGRARRRAWRRLLGLGLATVLAVYGCYDMVRDLAAGTISLCGQHAFCDALVRANAPAAFDGAIAFESFFIVFLLSAVTIGVAMTLNGRRQAAAH
ncbi:hypothetical protein [Burkholderia glumae]|uniref:hypothetical protein n=1 Tax=Burkholderia glumae TaxID=337 RepID=UPI0020CE40BA|nr:hypothetical protein [Burkholderia glumae]MCQ0032329.1 hypothetical protein [Burkholderia glumae]MCQ0038182.1 hypothetical protein [Burkholderia glumae]